MRSSAEKSIKQMPKNMMRVMDDYEIPADDNDSYGPFTKKVINADLNSNIAE